MIFVQQKEFDVWKTDEAPYLPVRSALYNLPPIGIGTADTESLSGYIARLALEHHLSTEILFKYGLSEKMEVPKGFLQKGINDRFARRLNGFGNNAQAVVDVLEKATGRTDIRFTTLLAWKDSLSKLKLLKDQRAWCPLCFEEQYKNGDIVYEKLLWSIQKVKACHRHEIPLVQTCQHCDRSMHVLSARTRPGFCSKCLEWLGSMRNRFDHLSQFQNELDKSKELWIAEKIGEMLAKSPALPFEPNLEIFIVSLKSLIQQTANGKISLFARQTNGWEIAIRRLLIGDTLPTIDVLVNICFPIDISPVYLLTGCENYTVAMNSNIRELKRTPNRFNQEEVGKRLRAAMLEYPPLSVNEVVRRLQWSATTLKRIFPEEQRKIAKEFENYLKSRTPRFSLSDLKSELEKLRTENPPPSISEIERRFKYHRRTLQKHFPELYEMILNRYKTYSGIRAH